MIARLQGWAWTALAVVAVLLGAYAMGGRAARRSAALQQADRQARAERAARQAQDGAGRIRDEIDADVRQLPAGDAERRLRDGWTRDR